MSDSLTRPLPRGRFAPRFDRGRTAIPPPVGEDGAWAGAPSALFADGVFWLAYRVRRPGPARGYANVLARSGDGENFETVFELPKERFDAMSLERPALVATENGRWRMYVSCATPDTKHWWVDLLEADAPEKLEEAPARTVLPGDPRSIAVKDPVIIEHEDRWHLWASCHPLDDRMDTQYATSEDGVTWQWHGPVLRGRPSKWDSRAVRITAVVLDGGEAVATYDGRATAEENWEERTGIAVAPIDLAGDGRSMIGTFVAQGDEPASVSPHGDGGLRYVSVVRVPSGDLRLYYEAARGAGSHDIRTEVVET